MTDARLVISTADWRPVNEHMVSFTDRVDVIVRAKDRESAREFLDKGASYVCVTDLLAADHLEALIEGEHDKEELRREQLEMVDAHGGVPRHSAND
jgi:monovalent cation:H+ antiporter-2, CPA2 family